MILDGYISKRRFAFLATFEAVWESAPQCYFWTFTPAVMMDDARFAAAWNKFNRRWQNTGRDSEGFKGLRVFEPFKSGFLHCHVVINQRVSVNFLRALALGTGLGRMNVRLAGEGDGAYLAKYMAKSQWKLAGGRRMWGKLGRWEHTKICNVEIDSPGSAYFRYAYHVLCHHIANPRQRYVQARVMAFKLMREEAHRA